MVGGLKLKGPPATSEIFETKSNAATHYLKQTPNDPLPQTLRDDMMEDSTILQDQQQQDEQLQLTSADHDTAGTELSTVDSPSDSRVPSKHSHSSSIETGMYSYLHYIL